MFVFSLCDWNPQKEPAVSIQSNQVPQQAFTYLFTALHDGTARCLPQFNDSFSSDLSPQSSSKSHTHVLGMQFPLSQRYLLVAQVLLPAEEAAAQVRFTAQDKVATQERDRLRGREEERERETGGEKGEGDKDRHTHTHTHTPHTHTQGKWKEEKKIEGRKERKRNEISTLPETTWVNVVCWNWSWTFLPDFKANETWQHMTTSHTTAS